MSAERILVGRRKEDLGNPLFKEPDVYLRVGILLLYYLQFHRFCWTSVRRCFAASVFKRACVYGIWVNYYWRCVPKTIMSTNHKTFFLLVRRCLFTTASWFSFPVSYVFFVHAAKLNSPRIFLAYDLSEKHGVEVLNISTWTPTFLYTSLMQLA